MGIRYNISYSSVRDQLSIFSVRVNARIARAPTSCITSHSILGSAASRYLIPYSPSYAGAQI